MKQLIIIAALLLLIPAAFASESTIKVERIILAADTVSYAETEGAKIAVDTGGPWAIAPFNVSWNSLHRSIYIHGLVDDSLTSDSIRFITQSSLYSNGPWVLWDTIAVNVSAADIWDTTGGSRVPLDSAQLAYHQWLRVIMEYRADTVITGDVGKNIRVTGNMLLIGRP